MIGSGDAKILSDNVIIDTVTNNVTLSFHEKILFLNTDFCI